MSMIMNSKSLVFLATVALVVAATVSWKMVPGPAPASEPLKLNANVVQVQVNPPAQVSGSLNGGKIINGSGTTGPPAQGSLQVDGLVNATGTTGPPLSGSVDVGKQVGAEGGIGSTSSANGCVKGKGKAGIPKVESCGALAPGTIEGHTSAGKTRVATTIKAPTTA